MGLMLNLVAALMVYSSQPDKPSLNRSLGHPSMIVVSSDNRFHALELSV